MRNNIIKIHHGYIITERDMELARYKYYFDRTIDAIFDVCCRYTGAIYGADTTPEEKTKDINKELDRMVKNFYVDDDIPPFLVKDFNGLILLSYLDDEHCGDCTKYPMTCVRCYVEQIIGCLTNPDNTPRFVEGESCCERQEDHVHELLTKQEPLGSEFQQVLYDNYWELITESNKTDDSVDKM